MIYLIQTDTTAGFCSKSQADLNALKSRDLNQPCILTTPTLKDFPRVFNSMKKRIRRSKKTSFIVGNKSFRYVQEGTYRDFLLSHGAMYSTSANKTGEVFCEKWARSVCDYCDSNELTDNPPSKIYRLRKAKIKKMR